MGAEQMDAADWMLNFTFRGWLFNEPESASDDGGPLDRRAKADGLFALRNGYCLLRRHDPRTRELLTLLQLGNPPRVGRHYGLGLVLNLLEDPPRTHSSIEPLQTWQFYWFERHLPDSVRKAGRIVENAKFSVLPELEGRIDHAFDEQRLRRLVTINLAMPDDVLVHDLVSFVRAERAVLAPLGGPYREALRLARKKHAWSPSALSKLQVLPYLDLEHWRTTEGATWTDYALATHLLQIDRKELKRTREFADLAMFDLALRAWLEPFVRGMPPRSKRGRK